MPGLFQNIWKITNTKSAVEFILKEKGPNSFST